MDTSIENTTIYFEAITAWMATHEGRMPGVEPASDEPAGGTVVDTPYMDDVAKHGISSWGGHPRVTKRIR